MNDASPIVDPEVMTRILELGFDPQDGNNPPLAFRQFLADASALAEAAENPLSSLAAEAHSMVERYGATGEALTVPLAVGRAWLDRELALRAQVVKPQGLVDAEVMLARRLVTVLNQSIQFEVMLRRSARRLSETDPSSIHVAVSPQGLLEAWIGRFRMFPVLASLVTSTVTRWLRAVLEMVDALQVDGPDLDGTLVPVGTPLTVESIKGDAGDLHLGGRSVMLLTLDNDVRLVYKPKQLTVTDVFRDLVIAVNHGGFSPPLRVHEALVRDGHTWEAFVPHSSCSSEAEIGRFYRRMGGWIRLLQALEGRDFWLDNLIADGEHPCFIDLETVLQPRRYNHDLDDATRAAQDRLDDSPVASNIVAMQTPIGPDVGSEDLGCFAPPRPYMSPFAASAIPGVTEDIEDARGYRMWLHPEHAPLLNGVPVSADAWFPDIERGYRSMTDVLRRMAPDLTRGGGLIDRLCNEPVRTIYRDTWTCVTFAQRSVAPPLLSAYARRNAFLEGIGSFANGQPRIAGVHAAEIRALAGMDVPFFTSKGSSDAIYPPGAEHIPGFFDGEVRDRVTRGLLTLDDERLETDVGLLRTAFWTISGADDERVPASGARDSSEPGATAWIEAAGRIGSRIASSIVNDDLTNPSWIVLTYHPSVDVEALSPIGSDLLTGRSGRALLFHDLWRATGEPMWSEIARGIGAQLARGLDESTVLWQEIASSQAAARPRAIPAIGAFSGVGGQLAIIRLLADTFDDERLRQSWDLALREIDWPPILAGALFEPVAGSCGFALALGADPAWRPSLGAPQIDGLAGTGGIRGTPFPEPVRSPGAHRRLSGLIGTRVAHALVRRRLDPAGAGVAWLDDVASNVLAADLVNAGDLIGVASAIDPASSIWPSLATRALPVIDRFANDASRARQIDAAELALQLYRMSGDADWRARAVRIAARWLDDERRTGSWFPDDLADDSYRSSPIWGLEAMASIFLRLADAPTAASPRTLDWRPWIQP